MGLVGNGSQKGWAWFVVGLLVLFGFLNKGPFGMLTYKSQGPIL